MAQLKFHDEKAKEMQPRNVSLKISKKIGCIGEILPRDVIECFPP